MIREPASRSSVLPTTRFDAIVQSLGDAPNLDSALYGIAKDVRNVFRVDICLLYLSDPAQQGLQRLMASDGLDAHAGPPLPHAFADALANLVAERSEPVNLCDSQALPAHRSGNCQGYLGVPVMHQSALLGVLVVQKKAKYRFSESELASLATLAAQIAGGIKLAEARSSISASAAGDQAAAPFFEGVIGAPGIANGTGHVVYSREKLEQVPDRPVTDIEAEIADFQAAVGQVAQELDRIAEEQGAGLMPEDRTLFRAYAMIARSDELKTSTLAGIRNGNWAAGALRDSIREHARYFEAMNDPYLRERADDIRDIGRALLNALKARDPVEERYPARTILVGEDLSALDLAAVKGGRLVAVISGHGSRLSHLAILARSMGIPAIMGLADTLPLASLDGKSLIVDGYRGRLYVEPDASLQREFRNLAARERRLSKKLRHLREQTAQTSDGFRVPLYTNAGLLSDLNPSLAAGSEGIGLYRTEFPFMVRDSFPTEEEQYLLYRQVLETFHPRPVTLRTLDIGGDKPLSYFPVKETNPFLGWRGIRISLDHPEMFLTQIRAMLRANRGLNNLNLLLPMISRVEDLDEALVLIQRAQQQLEQEGLSITRPLVGAMIEVPSAVYVVEALARRVDFLSVGTNDLIQYLLAVDRNNERVARWFDALHPAVIQALLRIIRAGRRSGTPVSVCGEAAGDPAVALLLIGMGVSSLSLSAGDLPRIKWAIHSFSRQRARHLLRQSLKLEQASAIRALLTQALRDAGLNALVHPGNRG
ncbi:phosphoenolpyruvate--protein phosphotransferase [Marinobacterium nitratireducens]|uniref:phosphoenolpyruvate--protein phosphotransferase n=1 Tax=Marinobacterium nitratireducens TaxID=518897 RepID=A0A917ZHB3_9GAMM|nr:phosphoenolpyruvate--protein phosphotransferase [Marinobacterium nitratireducens]GGO81797.1 phosphoenolpyruvate--protein phosphotransferase [Marinobacterium nitratireducens]